MTKLEHKKMIVITQRGKRRVVEYNGIYCGVYTESWKVAEIKEDVYKELKARNLLI